MREVSSVGVMVIYLGFGLEALPGQCEDLHLAGSEGHGFFLGHVDGCEG